MSVGKNPDCPPPETALPIEEVTPLRIEAGGGESVEEKQEGSEDPAARLQAELAEERRLRSAAEERELRWRADFENFRRRSQLEADRERVNMTQDILARFLAVLDDLDRAVASASGDAPESWVTGIDMVRRRFLAVLEEQGLIRLETVGQLFDPEKHEVMFRVEDSGQPANTILEELRPGYILGMRVIRPALVKIQA